MSDSIAKVLNDGTNAYLVKNWHQRPRRDVQALLQWVDADQIPRKIGVVGSHGVGKTTFVNMLAKELELPRIDEIARTIHRLGMGLDHQATIETQVLMWLGHFYESSRFSEFVSDRTILDVIAYSTELFEGDQHASYFLNAISNITSEIIVGHCTVFFYIPIEFELEGDGVRNEDVEWQHRIDERIVDLMNSFGIDYFPITGSKPERLQLALDYLQEQHLFRPRTD